MRHLLGCLDRTLPPELPLYVWADIDWGGLNILDGLRRTVSTRFQPYLMDVGTFDAHVRWARPLTDHDRARLARSLGRSQLADLRPLIQDLLARDLKLEQEAIRLSERSGSEEAEGLVRLAEYMF